MSETPGKNKEAGQVHLGTFLIIVFWTYLYHVATPRCKISFLGFLLHIFEQQENCLGALYEPTYSFCFNVLSSKAGTAQAGDGDGE